MACTVGETAVQSVTPAGAPGGRRQLVNASVCCPGKELLPRERHLLPLRRVIVPLLFVSSPHLCDGVLARVAHSPLMTSFKGNLSPTHSLSEPRNPRQCLQANHRRKNSAISYYGSVTRNVAPLLLMGAEEKREKRKRKKQLFLNFILCLRLTIAISTERRVFHVVLFCFVLGVFPLISTWR